MGKITLLVRTCILLLLLLFCSSNSLLAFEKSELENITSSSEGICYMFFESKEVKTLDFTNSLLKTFNASSYKKTDAKSSTAFVQPTITFASPAIPDICRGTTTAILSYTATTQNPSKYTILFSENAKAQGFLDDVKNHSFPNGSGSISIAVPATAPPGTYTATFFVSNVDKGNDRAISITIKDIPTVNKPSDQKICNNNSTTSINFSGNNLNGVIYNWTNSNSAIGLATSGTGNITAFTAKNTTNSPISANIVVTPTANGCVGASQNFTITVNPTTTLSKPIDIVACNNSNISTINFTGSNVSGTTYSWTNTNTSIGIGATGNGNISAFIAKNTTNAPIVANITVTPTANSCAGPTQSFQITVNPTATFTKPVDIIACNTEQIATINFTGESVTGTTYSWTNDNTNIGLPASGNGNISSFPAKNLTNAPIVAHITVTPTANSCAGTPQTFKITVNPTASFTKPADVVACNTNQIAAINFGGNTVNNTTYDWTNDNTNIGLPASGNGNISSFPAKNLTNAPIVSNITVTPTANSCTGTPQTFKITVNPTATFTKPVDVIACNNGNISAINFSGETVSGTSYNWNNDNTNIGLPASGNGNISNFTAKNLTNAPIVANITVTPTANSCTGTPQTFKITVNPTVTFTKPVDVVACNNGIISAINFIGESVSGTSYSWTNNNATIGLPASGNGNILQFEALNASSNPITATITVTPEANNCAGTPQSFIITVNPSINIEKTISNVACNGESNGSFTITNATGGNGNYRYSITNSAFNTTQTFSNLSAGIYTIYVQDTQGCTYQEEITITEPDNLEMITNPSSVPTSCFGGADGSITAGNVIGGNNDYVYSLDNTNFTPSPNFSGLTAGNYTIFVKDSKECSLQVTVNVGEAAQLSATLNKTDVSCFDGSDATITITNPIGGSGNYEYNLDNGVWQSSNTFTGLTAKNYSIAIRDSSLANCEVVINELFKISQPTTAITSQISYTRPTNFNTPTGTATVNPTGGTPGYTYEWRIAGQTSVLQTTKTATNLNAGTYEATIIDSKGCKLIKTITIIDALEAFIVPVSICEGDQNSIRVSNFSVEDGTAHGGAPNYTYNWTFGAGASPSSATGPGPHRVTYSNTGNKNITLKVTDAEGIVYNTSEQQYVGNCYEPCGQSSNIEFNPDNIYIGTIDGTPIDTSIFGNCDNSTNKYVFLKVDKSANIYNPYTELNYTVSNTLSTVPTSNEYFTKGCRNNTEIDDDPNDGKDGKVGEFIRLTSTPITYSCGNNLDIQSFYITWTNTSGKSCGQSNNAFCFSTNEPVILPTVLNADATATPINCKGAATGIITVRTSGGFAPYSYSLTSASGPFQTSNKFTNLLAGNYIVYVKGARGQNRNLNITVTEPATIVSSTATSINPVCFGETGQATVTGSGGTPLTGTNKYQYLWNDPQQQTTATATNLTAGDYTVTVIDANGCQAIVDITITNPPQLTVATTGEDQVFNCGFNATTLEGNEFDATIELGKWTILSGTGGTIAEPNNPYSSFTGVAGTYEVKWTITDLNSKCPTDSVMKVTFIDDCSQIDFDGIDDHVLLGDNYGLTSGAFSFEVWVKLKSITGVRTVLSKRNSIDLATGYDLIINNGAPTFRWGNNSVSTASKLATDRWYHLAVSYDSSKVYLYVDGILVGNKTLTNPSAISSPFIIGAMYNKNTPDTPVNYFNGWIEELRIWSTPLTEEQLHFMMNQRLELNSSPVKGTILPINVPGSLTWNNLSGYYQLLPSTITNGSIPDLSSSGIDGELKNIKSNQENTAPLPYTSNTNGVWSNKNTWLRPDVWNYPNGLGINGEKINWNIAKTSHNITSGGQDINLLGLFSESNEIRIFNPDEIEDEKNSGQGLTISHYLSLNGNIDLVGDSQLVQSEGSILDPNSTGFIEKDQQGTASSYNYNYWSSPVIPQANTLNSTYTVASVLLDGTNASNPKIIDFGQGVTYADGAAGTPRKISNYWIYKFRGNADEYSDYQHIGSTGTLAVGEGYTMKGTSGNAEIADRQNYVFKGKPNNGTITLSIGKDQNYMLGNPYPSAIDATKFILDNINASGGNNQNNIFNGALYFWDHFGGKTHTLREYVGGYATYNLIGGVKAIATDDRINSNSGEVTSNDNVPGQYIPVGQGFFINTALDENLGDISVNGGDVIFKNSQRAFVRETTSASHFLSQEKNTNNQKEAMSDPKIRLDFSSPLGYHRQILVGANKNATNGFDLGYDAPLNDYNLEDFFWIINNYEYVIQGVANFDPEQMLPIGIYISKKGSFKIGINKLENVPEETNIYLLDLETKQYFDLRKSEFTMEIEPGAYYERFQIVFFKPEENNSSKPDSSEENEEATEDDEQSTETDVDSTDIEDNESNENEIPDIISNSNIDILYMSDNRELAIYNPDLMSIQRVEIYNLLGQRVQRYMDITSQKEIRLPVYEYASGIYVVKLFSENAQVTKNIMLKK